MRYNDEVKAIFVSGLGVILGEVAINKKDIPYLYDFIQKTEFTDCFIEKKKKRLLLRLLLSRVKLKEVLEFIK